MDDETGYQDINETIRQQFESGWLAGKPQPIEALIGDSNAPNFLATLEELVHIELEFRWKNRSPLKRVKLEEYLQRFDQLNQPEIVNRLVQQEVRLRTAIGETPVAEEYQNRFQNVTVDFPTVQVQQDTGRAVQAQEDTGREMPTIMPSASELPDNADDATVVGSEATVDDLVVVGDAVPGYDLLGELGRGGMGVVYQARDQNLKRTVALKMILSGAHASDEDMQRFQIEAEAVAKLQHPNIVQIYEVSEHEGRPYIALEFADGGSLGEKIAGKPQDEQESAQLIETLAGAMQLAHENDIIHRDLKPANILLTADGEPRITDFGLAKRMDEDSNQTKSGAVMGTPSYMAPEQAGGKSDTLGPATDTYALGAILYHMLTGRPPFQAATQLDTIMQVLTEEPVAPRKLNPVLTVDLETICLKCLEKDAHRRYGSAAALGEDLRRFLAGEPILARPVTVVERSWKWAKRRPAVAGMISVIALALISLIAGGLWYNAQLQDSLVLAETRRVEAQLAQAKEEKQRKLAEQNFELAREAVDKYMTDVSQSELLNAPNMGKLRNKLLEGALDFYTKFSEQDSSDLNIQVRLAEAYRGAAAVQYATGEYEEAKRLYQNAVTIYETLQAEPGTRKAAFMFRIGSCYLRLARLEVGGQEDGEVSAFHFKSIDAYETYLEAHPENLVAKAQLCVARQNLASDYSLVGKFEESLKVYQDTRIIIDQLIKDNPKDYTTRFSLGQNMIGTGHLYQEMEDPGKSLECLTDSVSVFDELLKDHPKDQQTRETLGEAYNDLWQNQWDIEDFDGAFASANRCLEILKSLYQDFPENVDYLHSYSDANALIANSFWNDGKQEEAIAAMTEAYAMRMLLYRRLPKGNGYLDYAGKTLLAVAGWREERVSILFGTVPDEEFEKATKACRETITFYESRINDHPENVNYVLRKGSALGLLTNIHSAAKNHDEAMKSANERIDLMESLPQSDRDDNRETIRDSHRTRMEVADTAERYFESLVHLFRARELNDSVLVKLELFTFELVIPAYIAEEITGYPEALLLFNKYTAREDSSGQTWFDAARIYTLASRLVAKDESLNEEQQAAKISEYAGKAMALLIGAREREFFTDKTNLAALKTDKYLTSLRERDDFKKFVETLKSE